MYQSDCLERLTVHPRGKWGLWCERNQVFREIYNLFGKAGGKRKRREMRRYVVLSFVWLPWKTENWKLKTEKYCNKIRIKFSYKIDCSLRLQTHSISFYWIWILTNSLLYISHTCKISRKSKMSSYVINKLFKLQVFVIENYAWNIRL